MELSLRQIGYFLRLVESGSFTRAANALGITQPALSIAVSQLEKALEVQLIERGVSPVTLTGFGETFLHYATRVQRELQEARDEISALNSGTLGRLDICMGPSAAGPEVGAALTSMTGEFPNLEIHVQSGVMPAAAERLRNGEFSVYVGTVSDGFAEPGLDVTHLSTLSLGMVAGATHPLARKREVLPADLLDYPWIAIGNLDANLPDWQLGFRNAGVEPPRPAIDVRNIALVRSLLLEGLFVTVLPLPMAQPDIDAGLFALVQPASINWTLRLDAISRAGVTLPAAARIFLERLRIAFH